MFQGNLQQQMNKNAISLLPYQEQNGDFALKSMRKISKTLVPNNFNKQITFKGQKLNSCFKIKDTVNFEHKYDLVYHGKCPADNCNNDYVGETGRRISERIIYHNARDVNSHLLKQHLEKVRQCLQNKNFVIFRSGFRNNTLKRKISESICVKDLRLTEKSVELKLFN